MWYEVGREKTGVHQIKQGAKVKGMRPTQEHGLGLEYETRGQGKDWNEELEM